MMHRAWSRIEEEPYCFSRSYIKLQGHTALKIVNFDPNWALPDCNSSLESPMAAKWCTKLEVALKRPLLFFKVIRQISRLHSSKNSQIWPKLGISGLLLQLEFTDGHEMLHKAWNSKREMPYCFPRSFIKFQGHTGQNITDFDPNWAFPDYRPVAAFKSLRFALLLNIPLPLWSGVGTMNVLLRCDIVYSLRTIYIIRPTFA